MKNLIKLFLVLLPVMVIGQTQTLNYIKTATYKTPSLTAIATPTPAQAAQNVTYFDGLGRPIQQIAGQQSTTGKDIVTHIKYDAFGRQVQEYLPYEAATSNMAFVPTAESGTLAFYNTARYDNTANPFSQKKLEASPLNRVLKQAAPGAAWAMDQGHEIKLDYQTNTATEVRLYKVTSTWTPGSGLYEIAFVDAGNYAAGQLYKNVTYDENTAAAPTEAAGSTVEFKNKEGQVVLKRTYEAGIKHDTYYVYDPYGNLTYVLPPKAEGTITPAILDNLCYQYKYDYRNRLVEKKLPGKQWEFIVYDKLDRPVATGPANSPFSDLTTTGWLITKYDAFSRPVYTGWNNVSSTSATRKTLQDAQNLATVLFESKQTSGTIDGIAVNYSNLIAPTTFKLLTVNYYDTYVFPGAQAVPASIETQTVLTNVKTLPTGSWTRVPTLTAAVLAEISTTFYDTKAHPIRSYTANHLKGYTYTDSKLDTFSGQLQYSITRHKRSDLAADLEIMTKEAFTYSPQDRLLTQTHQINGGTIEVIANNTYDELGQLTSKKVGGNTQNINYTYNIRGWLTGINDVAALSKAGDPKDLFAFKINYNNTPAITGGKALYNGNIAETFWSSTSDATPIVRGYAYLYDNLNRLKTSFYKRDAVISNAYSENLTYDKNGNINSIIRNGNSETATQIDALVYTYAGTNTTNQLVKVVDNAPAASKVFGFTDSPANVLDDYSYDANGNMTKDSNKNITAITYNHLNLPTKITFATTGNIVYIYNAAGQKVQKIVNEIGKTAVTTDYLGGYQYDNGLLKFFPTAEGYVEPSGSSYKYVYQYKDHLGNVRLSYDKTLVIKEESNFYPFGLKQEGYNTLKIGVENKYKYNGKELQDEMGLNFYDYGARNYDPALGRWMNIDPLAETSRRFSPYTYALNNPVFFIDPDGMQATYNWEEHDKGNKGVYTDGGKTVSFEDAMGSIGKNSDGSENNNDEASSNSSEPPVNLFSSHSMGDVFNSVVNTRKYKNGDGVFSVWTHGAPGYMADYINGGGISTIEKFEAMMEKMSPNWVNARDKAGAVLFLFSCNSGATNDSNGINIAEMISKAHPNMRIVGAEGYYAYSKLQNKKYKISGIDAIQDSGDNLGYMVSYYGGKQVSRELYTDVLKRIRK